MPEAIEEIRTEADQQERDPDQTVMDKTREAVDQAVHTVDRGLRDMVMALANDKLAQKLEGSLDRMEKMEAAGALKPGTVQNARKVLEGVRIVAQMTATMEGEMDEYKEAVQAQGGATMKDRGRAVVMGLTGPARYFFSHPQDFRKLTEAVTALYALENVLNGVDDEPVS